MNSFLSPTKYESFDDGLEVRGAFLDISEAFNKIWHEGLILRLKYRKQRVVLNGQKSSCKGIISGVPQGFLLFLIYINPIQNGLFWVWSRMGRMGAKSPPPPVPKICDTYPTMMKLGTVIPKK